MRLIDADALLAEAMADGAYGYADVKQIADAPTIDATPVVRCKDCIVKEICRYKTGLGNDGFCSQGERKDDETPDGRL